ncbi:MAG TPA: hypothetical protein DHV26_06170 [Cytophagales bacterium]|nr:hypothetical protein [Cytophagales bacterium]
MNKLRATTGTTNNKNLSFISDFGCLRFVKIGLMHHNLSKQAQFSEDSSTFSFTQSIKKNYILNGTLGSYANYRGLAYPLFSDAYN